MLLAVGFTVPSSVDLVDADETVFDAVERVEEGTNSAWKAWRLCVEKMNEPVLPVSHLYGHSGSGTEHAHGTLHEVRP